VKSISPADGGEVRGAGLSTDGARAAFLAGKAVQVWALPGGKDDKPLASIDLPEAGAALALSPNGARLAVALGGEKTAGQVKVFDVAGGREVQGFAEGGPVASLAFHADNRTLVTASADKTARLLDVNVLAVFDAHPGGGAGVSFRNTG